MRKPKVRVVLRGKKDQYERQTLYLSYAWNYGTNYISLGRKLKPSDWDKRLQCVRPKATLGGMSVSQLNTEIQSSLVKAERIIEAMEEELLPFDFRFFEERFLQKNVRKAADFFGVATAMIKTEHMAGQIAKGTHDAYLYALKKFDSIVGKIDVSAITRQTVLEFKARLSAQQNPNVAAQYTRNCGIVFKKVVKSLKLPHSEPFEDIDIRVKRMSGKKTLSENEFKKLKAAFFQLPQGSQEREVLRRFFFLAKGLRFSDTQDLSKVFYSEVEEEGVIIRFFTKKAQKSDGLNIVPILPDEDYLLVWQDDGKLFKKTSYKTYYNSLRALTTRLIGRPITTHYGRHYAGDSILNMDGLTRDDVQKVLGIASETVADVYAQRDVKRFVRKYYEVVANKDAENEKKP